MPQASEAFLLADDQAFLKVVEQVERSVDKAEAGDGWDRVAETVERLVEPFNHVGLFQPDQPRMYRYTSAK